MRGVGVVYLTVLLAAVFGAPAADAVGSWTGAYPELTPLPRRGSGAHAGSTLLGAEEQLRHVQGRLRRSSAAAGKWLIARKEKILTEEEIYAEKVRKFARSIDQVSCCAPRHVDSTGIARSTHTDMESRLHRRVGGGCNWRGIE